MDLLCWIGLLDRISTAFYILVSDLGMLYDNFYCNFSCYFSLHSCSYTDRGYLVIEVSSFRRKQQSRCPPLLTWERKKIQFPDIFVLLRFLNLDDGQSPKPCNLPPSHYSSPSIIKRAEGNLLLPPIVGTESSGSPELHRSLLFVTCICLKFLFVKKNEQIFRPKYFYSDS
jgi:hypothetical protein